MLFEELLRRLANHGATPEFEHHWPDEPWKWLAQAGVQRWGIPAEFGGLEVSPRDFLDGYIQLGKGCLTTCFILTQRNAACRRIVDSPNIPVRERLLPLLATGERFATVGISHLTTSRQHLATPAVRATMAGESIVLSGTIPWVTGADRADWIVTGGTLEDGRQILVALPTNMPGVHIEPPETLLALNGSRTAVVVLEEVSVPRDHLVSGPVIGVMQQGDTAGTGSLSTSALALGLCERSLSLIETQAQPRPELQTAWEAFQREAAELKRDLFAAVENPGRDPRLLPVPLRQRANSLVIRIAQAALVISKGAGFVQGHPAERAVRESMFFLVWSCPAPVALGVLEEWACREGFPPN